MDNSKEIAQKIKALLIDLAINDKLPSDLTLLDENLLIPIIMNEVETEDYLETHFEIASYIDRKSNELEDNPILKLAYTGGQGALYMLAKSWSDEFQSRYKNVAWGEEIEYHDTLEEFISEKKNSLE